MEPPMFDDLVLYVRFRNYLKSKFNIQKWIDSCAFLVLKGVISLVSFVLILATLKE